MKPLLKLLPLAGLVLAMDQAAKWWLVSSLPQGRSVIITPFFNLVHWRNPGAAFSIMADGRADWVMPLISLAGLAALAVIGLKLGGRSRGALTGLGMAMGGALGNLVDRVRLGEVIDYLDFHAWGWHWPAFNVADAALSVGFCLLAWHWIRRA